MRFPVLEADSLPLGTVAGSGMCQCYGGRSRRARRSGFGDSLKSPLADAWPPSVFLHDASTWTKRSPSFVNGPIE